MVSFSCENCGDVLTKKKLDPHRNRCRGATFTCIDCMVHFPGTDYRSHTSCMTEDQKYQGALYKGKKQKPNGESATANDHNMSHHAYVEDGPPEQDFQAYLVQDDQDDSAFAAPMPPEAPTPPPAVAANVDVFQYMVDATPTGSTTNFHARKHSIDMLGGAPSSGGRQLVRFEPQEDEDDVDPTGYMVDDEDMVQYREGGVSQYETPAPKASRKKTKDSSAKKDKKRKRLHIETSAGALALQNDEEMTDAPPVLHSGLTGGLNRMMRPSQFPPSPDYSGGDAGETSPVPVSPVKKSKHPKGAKATRTDSFGSGLKALVSGSSKVGSSKVKMSKKRKHSTERKEKKKRRQHSRQSSDEKAPKLIEYKTSSGEGKDGESNQMVVFKPRSDLFLSFCTKGPDSNRGCSMNKALKRFHRERKDSGDSLSKISEEKELFRSLRMRRNDRGEIVLFSIDEIL